MPSFNPLFRDLLSEGWFVEVMGTHESCVSVSCQMFSRDYDEETGYTDIVFGDTECDPGSLHCVAKYHGVFEPRPTCPAMLVEQPLPPAWGYKPMPREMANAIAHFITLADFPETVGFMAEEQGEPPKDEREARKAAFWLTANKKIEALRLEGDPWGALNLQREVLKELGNWVEPPVEDYPDGEDARIAFWASINQQVSTMTAAGDPWGALRVQREAVDKLIGWVDPPPEEDHEIPEPNLEDMTPPAYSLIEAADAEQASLVEAADRVKENADYLPVGAHLLPEDFQSFLRGWNKTIVASTGDWLGEPRKAYRRANPDIWAGFVAENKRLMALYPTELAALKAYQASPEGKAEAEA